MDSTDGGEFIQGTKGSWNSAEMEIKDNAGNVIWKYDGEAEKNAHTQTNPYVLEHVNWVNCIRGGKPIEQASPPCLIQSGGGNNILNRTEGEYTEECSNDVSDTAGQECSTNNG